MIFKHRERSDRLTFGRQQILIMLNSRKVMGFAPIRKIMRQLCTLQTIGINTKIHLPDYVPFKSQHHRHHCNLNQRMDCSDEVIYDVPWFFKVYKDGRVERYRQHDFVPPSDNPITGVRSKDIVVVPENNVTVRLYLPKIDHQKFPLLVYFHGGGFVLESAFSTYYDSYLHSLAAETNVLVVSVEYRLAPEHKIPACYDDSWAVMKWVSQQASGEQGTEPWLTSHADFSRVFLSGDSAGANIANNMMMRASLDEDKLGDGFKLVGMALVHPYFGNNEPDKIWSYCCPENPKTDDPRFNPAAHPDLLSKLVCSKILICTAGNDFIRDRGWTYYEVLKKCGWKGEVEIKETEGEEHVFHLIKPTCEKAKALMKWLADFFQQSR